MSRSLFILFIFICSVSCTATAQKKNIICGADRTQEYIHLLKDKRIAVVANQTTTIGTEHLIDYLLERKINIVRVFAPEHGFRGNAEDGALIGNDTDKKTGLQVFSLYGSSKELPADKISDIDVVIFDIQDAGVRFYTFISTMHYVMKSCAISGKKLIILDRPNPNGNYIDGPVLQPAFSSFVGIHPIPVVHGLTIGELAGMINGEGWLGDGMKCSLTVIPCGNYSHEMNYAPPVPPSPNLPNYQSIRLYPSLAFFEGTKISVGRGTDFPFQVFGHPDLVGTFPFTPESRPGFSNNPPLEGKECRGTDLRNYTPPDNKWDHINLDWLVEAYRNFGDKDQFFTSYFDKLAGTDQLRKDIEKGMSSGEIRMVWQADLEKYRAMRERYVIYP